MKPQLLVVELWGLGDLVIATPFLRAASERYAVTLLAKPYAQDLQVRLWSEVRVVPFTAPWTAFTHKYVLWSWPWWEIDGLQRTLAAEHFELGLSARWDPRDHLLLRIGPRAGAPGIPAPGQPDTIEPAAGTARPGGASLRELARLGPGARVRAAAREKLGLTRLRPQGEILVHTGAGQPVRVWPLERYRRLVTHLRQGGYRVRVACDPDQQAWWLAAGESHAAMPASVAELLALVDRAGAFIGNDSGPGHLAAFCGVPTFTIFGPQLAEWFAPLHPASEWLEGKTCPYKPCSDYCRFASPCCMLNSGEDEVRGRVGAFLERTLRP